MNRIEFIAQLKPNEQKKLYSHFCNAFLVCLTPEEVCDIFNLNLGQSSKLRSLIIKRISKNISEEFLNCHVELLEHFLSLVAQKKCSNRSSVASYLSELIDVVPQDYKEKIIYNFLNSNFVGIRKRGYNFAFKYWNIKFETAILSVWQKYHDSKVVELIVEKFHQDFLKSNFLELESQIKKRHLIRLRLYQRTYPYSEEHLIRIAQEDGITYIYFCAHLGIILSNQESIKLAHQYLYDDRFGIIIYSLGIMKDWETLSEMYNINSHASL
jgi:hypothetical protein